MCSVDVLVGDRSFVSRVVDLVTPVGVGRMLR